MKKLQIMKKRKGGKNLSRNLGNRHKEIKGETKEERTDFNKKNWVKRE